MNQLNPGYHLTKIEITPNATFYRVKIIDMAIYHNLDHLVNTFCDNFTILCFSLYHAKAINHKSKTTTIKPTNL